VNGSGASSELQSASRAFWADKQDGGHRIATEDAFEKSAEELLGMLPIGGALLDVGCGSCQVTTYLAPHFATVDGLDFSDSMLAAAQERIEERGVGNIRLASGRLKNFSPLGPLDSILIYAVVQYLTLTEIEEHLTLCRRLLKPRGVVCLGLVPDAARRDAYYYGFFLPNRYRTLSRLRSWLDLSRLRAKAFIARDRLWDGVGSWFSRAQINAAASRAGFEAEFHDASYSDYRFHAVLRLVEANGA
jgi:cyclopropane fatty-acyl-phospholipid synthase-like methyltransferase